ncbi:MAG: hypothetical protein ACTHU0_17820 [Kofleriaceae bacterium]
MTVEVPPPSPDAQIAGHLERIIRRVKHSMNYRGSYSTRDILGSLVARWVQSGEWERLKELPAEQRHLSESVRRFILDRFDQLRRRGHHEQLDEAVVSLPAEPVLVEMIEAAELRAWIAARVGELERGQVDPRVRVPMPRATEIGQVLRLHLDGRTQREIARATGISLGLVNRHIATGTSYLVLLQSLEHGLT